MNTSQESNIGALVKLEEDTWPVGTRAKKEAFENRIKLFPEGVIGVRNDDVLMGLTTSCIIYDKDITTDSTWEKLTDYGMIYTHNKDGNVLYVVSLGVSPYHQKKGVGKTLIKAQQDLAKKLNLEKVVLGSRVPEFHKFDGTIKEYFNKKQKKVIL